MTDDKQEKAKVKEVVNKPAAPKWHGRRQGIFVPRNKIKYEGNVSNIVYRSGIELRLMKWLDAHPSILKWSSEETIIPYVSPMDNRLHRYFVDFRASVKTTKGEVKTYLIEVKWSTATVPPKIPKKKNNRRYLRECRDFAVNSAKWEAAKALCQKKGWNWLIMTEKQLSV